MGRLGSGETVERFEDRVRHADGSWRWISWTLVPDGDLFYAVGRDVTQEKEAVEELERAQEALRQSQKMEAMGQSTGGVAHDFNNLLTPIVGSLDLLQRKGVGNEREQRLIAGAIQSAERARTLVQRLLAFVHGASRCNRLRSMLASLWRAWPSFLPARPAPRFGSSLKWLMTCRRLRPIPTNWKWRSLISASMRGMPCPKGVLSASPQRVQVSVRWGAP
jgi:PAS domain-containing protein